LSLVLHCRRGSRSVTSSSTRREATLWMTLRDTGYRTAQNAHRAHAYKSMPPKKKRQRDAAQRQVRRWCAAHPEFMQQVESAMFYALEDGLNLTEADVRAMLDERGVELPFAVKDLMRDWNW
jgi:uncharacterized protein (DUF2267 family)